MVRRRLIPLVVLLLSSVAAAQFTSQLRLPASSAGTGEGMAVALLSDLNGDGIAELVVGAPRAHDDAGLVRILSGADGSLLLAIDGMAPADALGSAIATIGDVNFDGYEDLAIGAPGFRAGRGTVVVYSGAWLNDRVRGRQSPGRALLAEFQGEQSGDALGGVIATVFDVDRDGLPELALGMPDASRDGRAHCGVVWMVSGAWIGALPQERDQGLSWSVHELVGDSARARFGAAIAGIGDIDDDHFNDVAIGSPGARSLELSRSGVVEVYSGDYLTALAESRVPNAPPLVLRFAGTAIGAELGTSVAAAGDIDGDDIPDLIIGAPYQTELGARVGRVWVVAGPGRLTASTPRVLYTRRGELPHDGYGMAVAGAFDINGDSINDVVVAAPFVDNSGEDRGQIHVISGAWIRETERRRVTDGPEILETAFGSTSGGRFGIAMVIGYLDDGPEPDLLVGQPGPVVGGLGEVAALFGWPKESASRVGGFAANRAGVGNASSQGPAAAPSGSGFGRSAGSSPGGRTATRSARAPVRIPGINIGRAPGIRLIPALPADDGGGWYRATIVAEAIDATEGVITLGTITLRALDATRTEVHLELTQGTKIEHVLEILPEAGGAPSRSVLGGEVRLLLKNVVMRPWPRLLARVDGSEPRLSLTLPSGTTVSLEGSEGPVVAETVRVLLDLPDQSVRGIRNVLSSSEGLVTPELVRVEVCVSDHWVFGLGRALMTALDIPRARRLQTLEEDGIAIARDGARDLAVHFTARLGQSANLLAEDRVARVRFARTQWDRQVTMELTECSTTELVASRGGRVVATMPGSSLIRWPLADDGTLTLEVRSLRDSEWVLLPPQPSFVTLGGVATEIDRLEYRGISRRAEFKHDDALEITGHEVDELSIRRVLTTGFALATFRSRPSTPAAVERGVVFAVTEEPNGRELYVSDGTVRGTHLVVDSTLGPQRRVASDPVSDGTFAWFTATDDLHGCEVWVTDGTEAGTRRVTDVAPGPRSSFPRDLHPLVGGSLLFVADDGVHGGELFLVEGEETLLLKDLNPGPESSDPRIECVFQTSTGGLSAVVTGHDGRHGRELHIVPLFSNAASQVVDVWPGAKGSSPNHVTVAFDEAAVPWISFTANDGVHGAEPHLMKGESQTFALVADVWPGPRGSNSGAFAWFSATEALFAADDGVHGSELHAVSSTYGYLGLVADLRPGHAAAVAPSTSFLKSPLDHGLVFLADDGQTGLEPWFFTERRGLIQLADLKSGLFSSEGELLELRGEGALWMNGQGPNGQEFFRIPRTKAHAPETHAVLRGATLSRAFVVGDLAAVIAASERGFELIPFPERLWFRQATDCVKRPALLTDVAALTWDSAFAIVTHPLGEVPKRATCIPIAGDPSASKDIGLQIGSDLLLSLVFDPSRAAEYEVRFCFGLRELTERFILTRQP